MQGVRPGAAGRDWRNVRCTRLPDDISLYLPRRRIVKRQEPILRAIIDDRRSRAIVFLVGNLQATGADVVSISEGCASHAEGVGTRQVGVLLLQVGLEASELTRQGEEVGS